MLNIPTTPQPQIEPFLFISFVAGQLKCTIVNNQKEKLKMTCVTLIILFNGMVNHIQSGRGKQKITPLDHNYTMILLLNIKSEIKSNILKGAPERKTGKG
jgi:hypothetical protein